MYKLFHALLVIIWIIDILNISFMLNNVDIATFLDVTIPINTLAWLLIWVIVQAVVYMGLTRKQLARKKTYDALMLELAKSGFEQQFYLDQVDEYMLYYDNLQILNDRLADTEDVRIYNEILKEKRQVTKELRNILTFLKLKPTDEGGGGFGEQEFEDLQ